MIREGERFLDAVSSAPSANPDDPRRRSAAAFELFLTVAAENPLVRAIVSRRRHRRAARAVHHARRAARRDGRRAPDRGAARELAAVPDAQAELIGECLVRLAISYAALPKAGRRDGRGGRLAARPLRAGAGGRRRGGRRAHIPLGCKAWPSAFPGVRSIQRRSRLFASSHTSSTRPVAWSCATRWTSGSSSSRPSSCP